MHLRRIELVDFRIFAAASFVPAGEGTTVITGPNGTGKTSVLEAMVYLGTQRSFRGAPREALVRTGCSRAIVRAELQNDAGPQLVEAEVVPGGRSRTQVNRKAARGRRDLAAAAPCTIFSPDDLALISGGPSLRRDLLDDALGLVDPEGARAADEVDRILRQRAALLRQAGGRMNADVASTLDVWDQRLADAGKILVNARERLVSALEQFVGPAYSRLAGTPDQVVVGQHYLRSWTGELLDALVAHRTDDLRRGVNTVGPHRDDLVLSLYGERGPDAGLAGRATLPRSGRSHRGAPAGRVEDRSHTDPPARRRLLRTGPDP